MNLYNYNYNNNNDDDHNNDVGVVANGSVVYTLSQIVDKLNDSNVLFGFEVTFQGSYYAIRRLLRLMAIFNVELEIELAIVLTCANISSLFSLCS